MKEDFLKSLKEIENYTYTENGAVCYNSTGNYILDAFGTLGAMKNASEKAILDTFYKAFYSDKKLAMRLLFYVRDIRGGQGMRRVFRVIARSLAYTNPDMIKNNLDNFLFFGRGDDYLVLLGTPCEKEVLNCIKNTLIEDVKAVKNGGSCSLLAKWLPSENTSSVISKNYAKIIRKSLDMDSKMYRKMLSALRKEIGIVEAKMSSNRWDEINFEKLPSRASMIYSDAFVRHCEDAYKSYLEDVINGNAKINAGALFPADIISKILDNLYEPSCKDTILYNALWNALPNYFGDSEETGICMCDTSGSMDGEPYNVSLSLGLYCADKCKGPFKNHFITFDYKPVFQEITGDDIYSKVRNIRSINTYNTNFEAALQLILDAAIQNNLPQEDLPSKLYVISDMQFDKATGKEMDKWALSYSSYYKNLPKYEPFMQKMKQKFADYGYIMPAIVYWNVRNSKCGMFHETIDGEDCCMVSGYSPSLFKSVIDGTEFVEEVNMDTGESVIKQKIDPIHVMETTLLNNRYDRVYCG